jgi:hypothetical protein
MSVGVDCLNSSHWTDRLEVMFLNWIPGQVVSLGEH